MGVVPWPRRRGGNNETPQEERRSQPGPQPWDLHGSSLTIYRGGIHRNMEFLPGFYPTSSQSGIYLASTSRCTLGEKRAFRTNPCQQENNEKANKHKVGSFTPKSTRSDWVFPPWNSASLSTPDGRVQVPVSSTASPIWPRSSLMKMAPHSVHPCMFPKACRICLWDGSLGVGKLGF